MKILSVKREHLKLSSSNLWVAKIAINGDVFELVSASFNGLKRMLNEENQVKGISNE